MNVLSLRPIEEFAVDDDPRFRKDRPQRQRLSPPAMGEDEVGNEAGGRESARHHEDLFRSPAFGVKPARKGMSCRDIDRRELVPVDRYAFDGLRALRADCGQLERSRLSQLFRDISELSREIVVNEKDFHRRDGPVAGS